LLYFSQPAGDRTLYRAIHGQPIRSIVELGICLERTQRVLEVISWQPRGETLRYTGIDLFEMRPPEQPGPSLKEAFAQLRLPGVAVQLVPGEPAAALTRVANLLSGTDLLIVSGHHDAQSLARAWGWMPRMLSRSSLILVQEPRKGGSTTWQRLTLADIERRAAEAGRRRRQAA
jgi:hypothetical protein